MMNIQAKRDIVHKTKILNNAGESKNIAKTCRHFVAIGFQIQKSHFSQSGLIC
ncbi:hypothetical protein ACEU1J_09235 [Proteus mirabilis]|uniref:Integrase n=1 Tax=Proteus mirabilis TaxID=584 RepID=A0A2X2BPC7_PROMI|nr:hypothetical protein [Proteus mirabilis]MDM3799871.1 hypothetical protein [Proteus mirabilis]SPY97757.1 integrase [Proteus mirabilis]